MILKHDNNQVSTRQMATMHLESQLQERKLLALQGTNPFIEKLQNRVRQLESVIFDVKGQMAVLRRRTNCLGCGLRAACMQWCGCNCPANRPSLCWYCTINIVRQVETHPADPTNPAVQCKVCNFDVPWNSNQRPIIICKVPMKNENLLKVFSDEGQQQIYLQLRDQLKIDDAQ